MSSNFVFCGKGPVNRSVVPVSKGKAPARKHNKNAKRDKAQVAASAELAKLWQPK